jgi:hypothetical protein
VISEAVPYVYTAISSLVFLTLFLGFAPAKDWPKPLLGTRLALQLPSPDSSPTERFW